jgi:ABC-type glycerol-3-phosphate transport system permease component
VAGTPATHFVEYEQSARKGRLATKLAYVLLMIVLISGALLFLMPLYIMISLSLKTNLEIGNSSMWSWPAHPTWENYRTVLTDPDLNFVRKFFNTLFLAAVPTIASVVTAALVAFPFARLQFRGRDRLFIILLSTMMLPGVVTMIPGYVMFAKLGWINSYKPFVIPAFFGGGAFSIFLIRQFMMAIPREMDEAAKIDGASNAVIFWRLILPNCAPVLATLGVLGFVGGFKDLIGPLLMLNDPDLMTLEVGLRSLQQAHKTDFGLLMAGSMIVLLPIFVIFVFGQKYFARGITLTGGK